jgi:hypothetical protein
LAVEYVTGRSLVPVPPLSIRAFIGYLQNYVYYILFELRLKGAQQDNIDFTIKETGNYATQ